jgi:hypothetical protein
MDQPRHLESELCNPHLDEQRGHFLFLPCATQIPTRTTRGEDMQCGICVATKIDDWQLIKYAEALGYDRAWVPDSQMIWSDCYATLALAVHNTARIRLGTGVAIPGTRIAPVTAHSIASINRLAPGRVFLGVGTGHTAMRVMGMGPMKIGEFREYLRVVRALFQGEEVEYTHKGETRAIRFLHLDLGFINILGRTLSSASFQRALLHVQIGGRVH